jgi:hypothetical protein
VVSLLAPELFDTSTGFGGPVEVSRKPFSARAWTAALLRAAAYQRLSGARS